MGSGGAKSILLVVIITTCGFGSCGFSIYMTRTVNGTGHLLADGLLSWPLEGLRRRT